MKRIVFLFLAAAIASLALGLPADKTQSPYDSIKREAERHYAERSWSRAHELYAAADLSALPADEKRWVRFRLADTQWRSEATDRQADRTAIEAARDALVQLTQESERSGDRDRTWAEAVESLGDYYRTAENSSGMAAQRYGEALRWWAASTDLEAARARYLSIVWRMSAPEQRHYYGYRPDVPRDVLENALKIARTPDDRAHAAYLLARVLNAPEEHDRARDLFQQAISAGKTSEWYDDALFEFGQWLERQGKLVDDDPWSIRYGPDYKAALQIYRRILTEFRESETAYYGQSQHLIGVIEKASIDLSVSNVFLPGSEIEAGLQSRNVSRIDFRLVEVDLTRDVRFTEREQGWLGSIDPARGRVVHSWQKETGDKGDHAVRSERLKVEQKLAPGSYLLLAEAGAVRARELILISDTAVVLRASSRQALAWVTDAANGSPVPDATVVLWERSWSNGWHARSHDGRTDRDGLARFDVRNSQAQFFVAARRGDRQAFAEGSHYAPSGRADRMRIYAFTDRPAYRPGETVQWKITARVKEDDGYAVPAKRKLSYEIVDPRNSTVASGDAALNAFGSFWSSLELTASMPLGMYSIRWKDENDDWIGSAQLFRLEEYKLPEFRVSVETPMVDGKRKAFRLGERIEVKIAAGYYFGGPVANGTAVVAVRQRPHYHLYLPIRPYPWLHEPSRPAHYWGGGGEIVLQETVTLDSDGTATISFDTPPGQQSDLAYDIEARVTDASRREIVGNDSIVVGRNRYYAHATPQHYLHRPGERVTIDIATIDANAQPVSVQGEVKLTRERWREVWLSPEGKEVSGDELSRVRERHSIFPPPPGDGHPWKLKFRGYEADEIERRTVKTDANGKATFVFTPDREGFYRMAWASDDRLRSDAPVRPQDLVRTETTVWVATNATTSLGYFQGGVEVIVDKDTMRVGQTAPVMIVAPTNDRYVLFNVEHEDFLDTRVVHLDGTVKLIELPVTEAHIPNVFLSAQLVTGRQLYSDSKEIVVPPEKQFVDVVVTSDAAEHQPREQGRLTVSTRDSEGRPVAAEVALAFVDESVFSIQRELAPDPRQFFFGDRRPHQISTTSSFARPYRRLKEKEEKDGRDEGAADMSVGRAAGNYIEDAMQESAVAESITVTAAAPMLQGAPPPPPAPAAAKAASGAPEAVVVVRSDFRSTIFWRPDLVTSADGEAVVDFTYPDSLTTWKATARAVTAESQVGIATATTVTRKPLIVRLQAPRFFVVGDEVTISAVVNNNTDQAISLTPELTAEGLENRSIGGSTLQVPAHGEARADWRVIARKAGEALLRVSGRGPSVADAMEKRFTIFEHGVDKLIANSGKTRESDTTIRLELPAERRHGSTTMSVQVTPSIAVTMLDALPYLLDYPYGCTEQTMSRFLPAVIVAKTLHDLGVSRETVASRIFGGIETESAGKTHPDGKRDLAKLEDVVSKGLARLYDFQHGDGGWGWWKEGESDPYMTAYVVWGLALARDAGLDTRNDARARAAEWLRNHLVAQENDPAQQSWMLHALAAERPGAPTAAESQAIENVWKRREQLRPYARALFTIALHSFGMRDRALILTRNLENGVKVDRSTDSSVITGSKASDSTAMSTAHWGEDGFWWRWSDGPVESTAFALRALMLADPNHALVEPSMNWLVKNRRGAQWSNTRDTAIALLSLNEYLRRSGELTAGAEFEISVNGQSIGRQKLAPADLLRAPSRFVVPESLIRSGANDIRIRRLSGGALYYSAQSTFFSLEEPVLAAGNEIFVRRDYYRVVPRPTLLAGYEYSTEPLKDGGTVASGDRIEVVVRIETKNDYEYLLFEDLKPAGFEAVEVQSGGSLFASELKRGSIGRTTSPDSQPVASDTRTGRTRWIYRELRDRKVALFADKLPQGIWEIRYNLRAETPGKFHALPLLGQAMYVPEIRANGEETRVTVTE